MLILSSFVVKVRLIASHLFLSKGCARWFIVVLNEIKQLVIEGCDFFSAGHKGKLFELNPTKKKNGYMFCRMLCCRKGSVSLLQWLFEELKLEDKPASMAWRCFLRGVRRKLGFDLFSTSIHSIDLFRHKPDYAGRPELTKKLRITTGKTLFTEGDIVF